MRDRPDTRPLPTQDNTTQRNANIHSYSEQDSNLQSQHSSDRRQYLPQTARILRPARTKLNDVNLMKKIISFSVYSTKVYPKVSWLDTWSENCKWYNSLHCMQLYRYFVSQSSEFCRHNPLCCFSTSVYFVSVYFLVTQSGNFWIHTAIEWCKSVRCCVTTEMGGG
jgi:hypothetical protein